MSAYLITSITLNSLSLLLLLTYISTENYPRISKHTRGEDNVRFILCVGFIIWAALLLKGGAQ